MGKPGDLYSRSATTLNTYVDVVASIYRTDVSSANATTGRFRREATKAAFHLLALPPVANIGTFLSFAIPSVVGKSFLEGNAPDSDRAFELMVEGYDFSDEEYRLLELFSQMLDAAVSAAYQGGENGPSTNVSLFEVPAIMRKRFAGMHLSSVLVYFCSSFPVFFMPQLSKKTIQSSELTFEYSYVNAPRSWAKGQNDNYFGRLLSQYRDLTLKVLVASVLGEDSLKNGSLPNLPLPPGAILLPN